MQTKAKVGSTGDLIIVQKSVFIALGGDMKTCHGVEIIALRYPDQKKEMLELEESEN